MNPLKLVSILIKPVEIALLVAGMGFVAYFTKEAHDFATKDNPKIDPYDVGQFGRYEFFMYSTGVGVVEKKHGALAMSAVQAIWTLQLLVSTALVAKTLSTYKKKALVGPTSFCEKWDKAEDKGNRDHRYTCGQVTGGVVCGFLGMAAFAVDTVISLLFYGQSLHQYQ